MAIKTPEEDIAATREFMEKIGMIPPPAVTVKQEGQTTWQYELVRIRAAISAWYEALEVDILWMAVWCILIGYLLFLAFDVTSTFPVSVKWGIASGSLFLSGAGLAVLSVRRQRTRK